MTERLYYHDCYLREFRARVLETSDGGRRVYLDRTAFYPASGGQPHDTGRIGTAPVLEVIDEGERIAHATAVPVEPGAVECSIDWDRRFDHMQQHSGQHLLSAVFLDVLGLATVSFHLGQEVSTIDLEAAALDSALAAAAERRANEVVFENRPIAIGFSDAAQAQDLRKAPGREGELRIVTIHNLDRSACGGTHVRHTGEIGPILIRKWEKVRNTVRVEFLCGMRAVRRAHADFEALSQAAQVFSARLDEVPALIAAQADAARTGERLRRKLQTELAQYKGRELYEATAPDQNGLRRLVQVTPSGSLEDLRALAQSYTAQPRAVFIAALEAPPSILMAASPDSGIHAGERLKAALAACGGRGGGSARLAQGSLPATALLQQALASL